MEALLYGVGAAVAFGFGDYAAAMATRRVGVVLTSIGMQSISLVGYAIVLALLGRWPVATPELIGYGFVLGLIGVTSAAALYRALAIGPIAVVSPVVASYAALTVILIVAFLGERLTVGQGTAIAVVFVGVVVASTDFGELRKTLGRPTEGVRYGLVATIGFAVWGWLYAAAVRATDGLGMILVLRAFSVLALTIFVVARRTSLSPLRDRRALALIVVVGVLDTAANVLLSVGIASGFASFVMTGSGAYPLIPALLAILVLRERLAPNQYVGVAVLIAGLVALGLQS
ncbi:MAG TPA: EamA family transporter [Candidatus Limnocylindria bacterium]|nr:EamA family transporter [Candidatus Limnocylindria bacterium]